jgi:hypothetical protein
MSSSAAGPARARADRRGGRRRPERPFDGGDEKEHDLVFWRIGLVAERTCAIRVDEPQAARMGGRRRDTIPAAPLTFPVLMYSDSICGYVSRTYLAQYGHW